MKQYISLWTVVAALPGCFGPKTAATEGCSYAFVKGIAPFVNTPGQ